MIRALIFDFDGLILDTEAPDFQAWQEMFEEHGCSLDAERWRSEVGMASTSAAYSPAEELERLAGRRLDMDDVCARRRSRYLELIDAQQTREGVKDLLRQAQSAGMRLGVASSSSRSWVEGYLSRLDLLDYFEVIKTVEDAARAKPAPDLYLAAVQALGVAPGEAVALEDSWNGILAARAAGLWAVAVPNEITRALALAEAHVRLETLKGVSLEALVERVLECAA